MKRTGLLLALATLLILVPRIKAQISVGAAFTGESLVLDSGSSSLVGTTLSAQAETGDTFRYGLDLRGVIASGSGIASNSAGIGPRLAIDTHRWHLRPYAEGLIGVSSIRPQQSSIYTTRVPDLTGCIGIDRAVSAHLDWRIFEYSHSSVFGSEARNQFSTGILYRFSHLAL